MGIEVMDLPMVNAILNSVATLLLIGGFVMIRQGRWKAHRAFMIGAFGVSTLFLVSYVTYHTIRQGVTTPFGGEGDLLILAYRFILFSHILLAAAVPFLAIVTLSRGLKERINAHRKIARWTLPIWLYVSVTGVLVYLMLYVWYPSPVL